MYIWIGCGLPEAFERSIREQILAYGKDLDVDLSGFTLPQHISLKISFEAGAEYEQVLEDVEQLLRHEQPIRVVPAGIERKDGILWVHFEENSRLQQLHRQLDERLLARFGIPQHPFDREFQFHSTLCMGMPETMRQLAERLSKVRLPEQLQVDAFLLGISQEGKSGTYRVVRKIDAEGKCTEA